MGGLAWSWGPFPGCAHPLSPARSPLLTVITLAGCSVAGIDPLGRDLSGYLEEKMSLEVSLGEDLMSSFISSGISAPKPSLLWARPSLALCGESEEAWMCRSRSRLGHLWLTCCRGRGTKAQAVSTPVEAFILSLGKDAPSRFSSASVIHSFSKGSLYTYCVLGSAVGAGTSLLTCVSRDGRYKSEANQSCWGGREGGWVCVWVVTPAVVRSTERQPPGRHLCDIKCAIWTVCGCSVQWDRPHSQHHATVPTSLPCSE